MTSCPCEGSGVLLWGLSADEFRDGFTGLLNPLPVQAGAVNPTWKGPADEARGSARGPADQTLVGSRVKFVGLGPRR